MKKISVACACPKYPHYSIHRRLYNMLLDNLHLSSKRIYITKPVRGKDASPHYQI